LTACILFVSFLAEVPKSHRAIGIAHKNNCDAIIDDGLLIKGTKILAGTSAKKKLLLS